MKRSISAHCGHRQDRIIPLPVRTRRNLWDLLLFLLISVVAFRFRTVDFSSLVPAHMEEILGAPPPAGLIGVALVVYTLSAVVLILNRLMRGLEPSFRRYELALRSVFYPLFFTAGALDGNVERVFAAGLLLFMVEQVHASVYAARVLVEVEKSTPEATPRDNPR
jgi:hypothetical protein